MSHRFSLTDIALWLVHWLFQKILDVVPVLSPYAESPSPPAWWTYQYNYYDWRYGLLSGNIPSSGLIDKALAGLWLTLGDWVEEVGAWVESQAKKYTRDITGYVSPGFSNFGAWVRWLQDLVGSNLPAWAYSVASGLSKLYYWLPYDIRVGLISWATLFWNLQNEVKQWAKDQYDAFTSYAYGAYYYVLTWGETLKTWWNLRHVLIDNIAADPAGWVLGLLPPGVSALLSIAGALTSFYNLVWSSHKTDLVDFVHDPFGWLYKRAETWILDHVW